MSFNVVSEIDDRVKIQNVLMSVSDKTNLETMVLGLVKVNLDVKIYSTGGTYSKVKTILAEKADKNLISVSDYTSQPEMQGGLVKTLDFKIYLGLLSETYNSFHQKDLLRVGGVAFDMVVVNLYPFEEAISREMATLETGRGNIDIGGPCMCRASAKNFIRVASVCNPDDYAPLIEELAANQGKISYNTRFELAKKAFAHTANYDRAISDYFNRLSFDEINAPYQKH